MYFFYSLCLVSLFFVFYTPRVTGQCSSRTSLIQEATCNYNYTLRNTSIYPNQVINETTEISEVVTLVNTLESSLRSCSSNADRSGFICATFFPSCDSGYGPCSSLCEKIRQDCSNNLPFLPSTVSWIFNCTRYEPNSPCIQPIRIEPTSSSSSTSSIVVISTPLPSQTPSTTPSTNESSVGCPPPSSSYYTDGMKSFTKGWIATWSTLCFLSTSLTLLTFIIKPSRFEYPWRPIIFLALCFNIHSLGYFFSLALGRGIITCPGNNYISSSSKWSWSHIPCLLNFGLLYYSMVSAFLWWLALTLSWFLSAVFKWSNESVGRLAPFFHVTAWVVPLLMMISLVAAQVISADELTGTCFIVRDESNATLFGLLIGVIIPLLLFLSIGLLFLIIGLISVFRIRRFLHNKGRQKESIVLEKLMFRIGIFVAVYVLPAGAVISCYIYELAKVPDWVTLNEAESCSDGGCQKASPIVFIIRIFMFLMIGILTGVWIWSKKTLDSWRSLGNSCCSNGSSGKNDQEPTMTKHVRSFSTVNS
ncbi:frizzled precursor [Amphimedon queenslandica]|uniref:FzdB n=1 Tax=Amphimedon queenslandica TaxID=400682 RepID=E2IJ98_AMPQE|nr:frizzled precursor [Amphimedon queenslandica]ADO16570.1 FzdB [Amphimedon queenslandica]|eukprot:NP_001266202.1 frizzled precursor [Amphimedon queenslandica]